MPRLFYEEIGSRIGDSIYNKKERAGENPESPARTWPGTNICEGSNTRQIVFTRE